MNLSRFGSEDKSLLLAAGAALVVGGCFSYMVNLNVKWAAYLFLVPFVLLPLYFSKHLHAKIACVIFLLIFAEKFLIGQRQPLPFMTVGVSLIFLLTVLLSCVDGKAILKLLRQGLFIWGIFLAAPIVAIVYSLGRGYGLADEQFINFQLYYIEFFLFFVLGFLACRTPQHLEKLFFLLVLIGGLVALLHLFSIATGINLEALRGAEEVAGHRDLSMDRNWRYGGVFGNPNTMAAYYVMFAPVALVMLAGSKGVLKRPATLVCLTLMILSLAFAGSRGGLLFGVVMFFLALILIRIRLKDWLLLFVTLALIGGIAKLVTDAYFSEFYCRVIERFNEEGLDPGVRMDIWRASWQMLLDKPLGIGVHWEIYMRELSGYSLLPFANPHNIYLSIALNGGFVGLFAFLLIIQRSARNCLHVIAAGDDATRQLARYCLLAIAGFALFGMTEPIFNNGFKINHIIGLILGIGWALGSGYGAVAENQAAADYKELQEGM